MLRLLLQRLLPPCDPAAFPIQIQPLLPPPQKTVQMMRKNYFSSLLSDLRLSHLAHTRPAHGLSAVESPLASACSTTPLSSSSTNPHPALTALLNVMHTLRTVAASRHRTVILSIHQPSFKILSTIDSILLLFKGSVVHHGTLSSLEAFLHSNGFTVPPQLNSLEYAMEILNQLPEKNSGIQEQHPSPMLSAPHQVRYESSRLHEIFTLSNGRSFTGQDSSF